MASILKDEELSSDGALGAANVHITSQLRSRISADLQEQVYARLGLAALVYAAAYLAVYLSGMLSGTYRALGNQFFAVSNLVTAASVLLSLGIFALARSRWLPPQAMSDLGLIYQVVAAASIDSFLIWLPIPPEYLPIGISWIGVWILCFALIVPSTPGKAMLAALASASMTPLLLLIGMARGSAQPSGPALLQFILPNYVCVLMAFASVRILHQMRQQVDEARQMGSYRLVELLGQGGMGEVWKAQHRSLARPAAIKLIRPSAIGSGSGKSAARVFRRFEREAQSTAALQSVHTITLYDFGISDDDSFYYVMELLRGLDLEQLVERFGPLPASRAVHLLRQACHSLGEAHSKSLIHRDVKPANIYACRLGPDCDFVKVLDFGLVKPTGGWDGDEATRLTQTGITAGTPAYMAPEMVLGQGGLDARADIYALGCVGFWLLTGSLVFEASSAVEMAMHHIQTPAVAPSHRTELEIPAGLDDAILACLQKSPSQRPANMEELSGLLKDCGVKPWGGSQADKWWQAHLPEFS